MGGLMAAFLAEVGMITYRDIAGKDPAHAIAGLPLPADYLAAVVLFGVLGLASRNDQAKTFATVLGWGFVIATAMNLGGPVLNPSSQKNQKSTTTTSSSASSTTKGAIA